MSYLAGSTRNGTYQVQANRIVYPALDDAQFSWSEPAPTGAITGPVEELIRPVSATAYRFSPTTTAVLALAQNGNCAALLHRDQKVSLEETLVLLELASGRRTELMAATVGIKVFWLY